MINDDIDRYAMTWYDVRNVRIFYVPPEKPRGVASIQEILGASRRGFFRGRDLGGHRSQDFLQEMMGFYMCFRNVLIIFLISDIRNGKSSSSSSPKRNGVKALPWPGPSHSPQKALPVLLVCGVVSWLQAGDVLLSFWKIAGQFCLWHLENLGKDKVHEWFLKVWDLEFHIQCSHSNRNRIAIAQQWVQVF